MKSIPVIVMIILVIIITVLFFFHLLPLILFIMVVILPNWLGIKKLSHDVKIKLSIVFLIIGILMLIGGVVGFNSTSKRDYRLENTIGDTIKNNSNTYLDNNNKEISNKHEIYMWIIIVGGLITAEGIIFFIGSSKKQEQTCNDFTEKDINMGNQNIKKLSDLLKDGVITEEEFNKKVINLVRSEKES